MEIGNLKLENPYILAPMAGVTDLPFRLLCKEQGAGLLCMEMIRDRRQCPPSGGQREHQQRDPPDHGI